MRSSRHHWTLVLLGAIFVCGCSLARAWGSTPITDPAPLFDQGAELLAKDPFAAKAPLAKAAGAYEMLLQRPLSQQDRARLLYNLGTARQLGGELGPAVLAFRRADLLMPALPGLSEHLASARAAVRGEPAPDVRGRDVDAGELARAWTLSVPRHWLWRTALGAYVAFWMIVLARGIMPARWWRPSPSLAVGAAFVGVLAGSLLAEQLHREHLARRQAVVLSEIASRLQPDDLIGQPSPAGVLKPGAEVAILEERTGGNGQNWLRVHPFGTPATVEESAAWIPESSVERVQSQP